MRFCRLVSSGLAVIGAVAALVVAVLFYSGGAVRAGTVAGFTGNTPRPASCAKGDHPEDALQGEVTLADRKSGRSRRGYCNLTLSADAESALMPTSRQHDKG